MDLIPHAALVLADGTGCFAIPVSFVGATAEPAEVLESSGQTQLHPEAGELGKVFPSRPEMIIDGNTSIGPDGI